MGTVQLCVPLVDKPDQGTHLFLLRSIFNLDKILHDSGDGVLRVEGKQDLSESCLCGLAGESNVQSVVA